jgi:hypothetical protein
MAPEMGEHGTIGSNHLALTGVVNALLAHNAVVAGRWTSPALRVGKEKQTAALHLIPDKEV